MKRIELTTHERDALRKLLNQRIKLNKQAVVNSRRGIHRYVEAPRREEADKQTTFYRSRIELWSGIVNKL